MPKIGVAKKPCGSCPYRRDVPSGLWEASEYAKLPHYDGEIMEQLLGGAGGLFLCHQRDGNLCAGWLGCHGPENLLAIRVAGDQLEAAVYSYKTDVPLFHSGAEAAAHGMADIESPAPRARKMIDGLVRKVARDA